MNAVELIEASARCFSARDWDGMRALYHPESLAATVVGGDATLGPDELIDTLRRATASTVYQASYDTLHPTGAHGAIVEGRVRYRHEDGGFADVARVWLYVEKDGLIYRTMAFGDVASAERAYAESAPDLGLPQLTRR